MKTEEFWVLPCLQKAFHWVVYRKTSKEILVELSQGSIIHPAEKLTEDEAAWFTENLLINNEINHESIES